MQSSLMSFFRGSSLRPDHPCIIFCASYLYTRKSWKLLATSLSCASLCTTNHRRGGGTAKKVSAHMTMQVHSHLYWERYLQRCHVFPLCLNPALVPRTFVHLSCGVSTVSVKRVSSDGRAVTTQRLCRAGPRAGWTMISNSYTNPPD